MRLRKRSVVLVAVCLALLVAGCSGTDAGSTAQPDDGTGPAETNTAQGDGDGVLNVGIESDGSERYVYIEPERTIPGNAFLSVTPDSTRYGSIGSGLAGELSAGQRYYVAGYQDAQLGAVTERPGADSSAFDASQLDEPLPVEVVVTLENDTEYRGTATIEPA